MMIKHRMLVPEVSYWPEGIQHPCTMSHTFVNGGGVPSVGDVPTMHIFPF